MALLMTSEYDAKMRSLNQEELEKIEFELQSWVGAQLQEVLQSENEFGFGFYHDRTIVWLWFDLSSRQPMVLRFGHKPPLRAKLTKPLLLFTKAHLVGRRLLSVRVDRSLGRVLRLAFHDPVGKNDADEAYGIEARLFPGGVNLGVFADGRTVSLHKPKEMTARPQNASETSIDQNVNSSTPVVRTWDEICQQWLDEKSGLKENGSSESILREGGLKAGTKSVSTGSNVSSTVAVDSDSARARAAWEKICSKKAQALTKMHVDLEEKKDLQWRAAGQWLKANLEMEVPQEFKDRVDPSQSLSWNIENCFAKAKENERKLAGAKARIESLEAELQALRERGPEVFAQDTRQRMNQAAQRGSMNSIQTPSLLEKAKARGRKLQISEDLEAYIGKNAIDNLALLRRAQPHDLWLHLRDYTGAHAILRRAKNRNVTDIELNEVGRWVVMQSLHKSESELKGGRYDMIVAECRHVRPIKGDKLGRVNYQNDRLFVVRL